VFFVSYGTFNMSGDSQEDDSVWYSFLYFNHQSFQTKFYINYNCSESTLQKWVDIFDYVLYMHEHSGPFFGSTVSYLNTHSYRILCCHIHKNNNANLKPNIGINVDLRPYTGENLLIIVIFLYFFMRVFTWLWPRWRPDWADVYILASKAYQKLRDFPMIPILLHGRMISAILVAMLICSFIMVLARTSFHDFFSRKFLLGWLAGFFKEGAGSELMSSYFK